MSLFLYHDRITVLEMRRIRPVGDRPVGFLTEGSMTMILMTLRSITATMAATIVALLLAFLLSSPGTANSAPAPSNMDTHTTDNSDMQSNSYEQSRNDTDGKGRETITILFFGDSITAGFGLDPAQAFPALIENRADSLGLAVEAVNAGVSGETSAGGLRRVDWILQRPFDIFVLELGANDGLRGIDPDHTRDNLQQIMDKVRERRPDVTIVLTGMEAPPNMGDEYIRRFRQIYRDLAGANDIVFMPFILEDVAGEPELNQADGIHPTAAGHRVIAGNVWKVIEPLLRKQIH